MLILHLSDTHSKHHELRNLPPADIIIHSGDISFAGSENEVMDFIEWFGALPYKYKIFIAGNHDFCLFGEKNIDRLPQNCFYLCNSSVTIQGVKFYGIPMFMEDTMSGDYDRNIQKIPSDTNVLITHQPPYSILDYSAFNRGDRNLLQIVLKIKPKYHLFGHIHAAYGIEKSEHTTFVNAAILSENYELINEPILLKI